MQADSRTRAYGRRTTILRWSERLLVIAGITALGWCGLLVGDANVSQWKARRSLDIGSLAASVEPPHVSSARPSSRPPAPVRQGSAIGELSIPRLALAAVVLHGSDTRTLRRGPGHLENTAFPGTVGNAVIAGHRDTFFRGLGNIAIGDDVFVDTKEGHFHYRVTSMHVVKAQDLSVLDQAGDAILTLITCYPFWVLGPAPDRFVVRAALVANASFATRLAPSPTSYEPIVARAAPVVVATKARVTTEPIARDDTALVRQAIERFRVTYNARLASHNDPRPEGLLELRSCNIALAGNQAVATCATGPVPEGETGASPWTIRLERADQGWAIKTILCD